MSIALTRALNRIRVGLNTLEMCCKSFASSASGSDPCEKKHKNMWFNPVCCNVKCPDVQPRLDEKHYKPSPKDRQYQQTWSECPKLRLITKKLCCTERYKAEPMERRAPKKCIMHLDDDIEYKMRHIKDTPGCGKIHMVGCRQCRDPPHCFRIQSPKKCKKVQSPFPSFSECRHPKLPVRKPTECGCLHIRPFCPFGNEKKPIN